MNVEILKLVNGDDLISDVSRDDAGHIILDNPARLVMFPSDSGDMSLALLPWCPYSDKINFTIKEDHVLTNIPVPQELYDEYNDKFGPGIVTPPSPSGIII